MSPERTRHHPWSRLFRLDRKFWPSWISSLKNMPSVAVTRLLAMAVNAPTLPTPDKILHLQRTGLSPRKQRTTTTSRLLYTRLLLRVQLLLLLPYLIPLLQLSNLLPLHLLSCLLPPDLPSPSLTNQSHHVYGPGLRNLRNGRIAWKLAHNKKKGNRRKGRRPKRRRSRPRRPKLVSKTRQTQPQRELQRVVPVQGLQKISARI